ncbi:MAG: pilus assembly protein PilP [Myxococcota bacterium]
MKRMHGPGMLAALFTTWLAGCDSDSTTTAPRPSAPTVPVATEATRAELTAEPASPTRAYVPVRRAPDKDPFRAPELEPPRHEGNSELERYDLDELKLVGIVVGVAVPRAMVEDPHGVGHMVTIGTALGRDGARVSAIRKDEIVVERKVLRPLQKPLVEMLPLRLAPQPG